MKHTKNKKSFPITADVLPFELSCKVSPDQGVRGMNVMIDSKPPRQFLPM